MTEKSPNLGCQNLSYSINQNFKDVCKIPIN